MKVALTPFQRPVSSVGPVMSPRSIIAVAAFVALAAAAPALSQDTGAPCRLCDGATGTGQAKPATPVSLAVETSLDFDRLILAGAGEGSAEIGPDGSRAASGSISAIGARAIVGHVTIRGEPGRSVRITLPDRIELTGLSGGTIRLDSIRSDLSAAPRLGSDGTLSFRFGGILRVSGDVDGEFRGEVPIDVEYF